MSEVEKKLEDLEAIATEEVVAEAAANEPAKKAVAPEPSHIAKTSKEVTDTGPAVVKSDAPKKDYAKDVNPTKDSVNAKADKGDSAPVSQGSSSIKPPKESIAAGDQVEHDGEELAEKSKDAEAEKTAEDKHKDKIKEINVKEDVDALINGQDDLSDEFKAKAATIFEAAIKSKVGAEIERLEEEYAKNLEEAKETAKSELTEKVDSYLNYVVEEWMKENELAIEKGVKGEIAEDFISGLKQLFEDHYIDIPDEKYNVLDAQASEIEELKGKLNEATSKIVDLNKEVGENTKASIFESVSDSLADSEKEKFKGLVESIDYEDADSYKAKLETIKGSYFVKEKAQNNVTETNDAEGGQIDMSESMSAYTAAISRTKTKKLY
jgi:hypothetical protein|tara:strand:+ start:3776 stop:4915 length:1140 start_codon:yes stop_codon:yes gene_type:complete